MKSEIEVPGGWGVERLENISNKITDGFHNIPHLEKTGIPLLDSTYIDDSYNIKINEAKKFISVETDKKSYARCKPKQNDILISSRGSIGKLAIVKKGQDFNIMANIALIRSDDKLLPVYLLYYLSSKIAEKQLGIQSYGSSQKALYLKNIKNLKIIFPQNLNEQQKIADILSKVDEQIDLTKKIIDKTRKLKKGLMQKLLTKGIGHTKFKKTELGEIPEKWEVVRTENLLINKKGSIKIGPFGSQLKREFFVEEGYKVYGQENIFRNDFTIGDRYVNEERFYKLKTCELFPGDIVISMMGTIGKCSIVPNDIEKGIMDSHLLRLQINERFFFKDFLKHIFVSPVIQKQIISLSVGAIMAGLSSKVIKKIIFPKPELNEQKQIASILSKVDEQIQDNKKELNNLKELKKGLMQDLLTGKVRVSV